MMKERVVRLLLAASLVLPAVSLIAVAFDADARRLGGGTSMGRQSPNVTQQRRATMPPASPSSPSTPNTASNAAAAGAPGAATAGAKHGASRWLGPIAGIAAGLGIAALLSHLGLSGAVAEFIFSMLIIAALVFAVLFLIRRLRGGTRRTVLQGAYGASYQAADTQASTSSPLWRQAASSMASESTDAGAAGGEQSSWFIPADFDRSGFLQQAKAQFTRLQACWDSGDTAQLRAFLTDDMFAEVASKMAQGGQASHPTEVVLLNAELLGIEAVADGYLASVRFSGMLRETPATAALRFEEVWNLFKATEGGWLLAGIQQIAGPQDA